MTEIKMIVCMLNYFKSHPIFSYILIFFGLEIISFYAFFVPSAEMIIFGLIIITAFYLSLYNIKYGLYAIIAELFIGSKGYLFFFDIGNNKSISIRIGLFLIVLLIWAIFLFRDLLKNGFRISINQFKNNIGDAYKWYFLLFIAIAIGIMQAFVLGNNLSNIFFDFNAFIYLLLLFPLAQIIKKRGEWENIFSIILASGIWVSFKSILVFYLFAHSRWLYTPSVYKWIRDTGVGEITKIDQGFYRVFFQGQIYHILLFLIIFAIISYYIVDKLKSREKTQFLAKILKNKSILSLSVLFLTIVIMSFSRSFWVGGVVGLLIMLILLNLLFKANLKNYLQITIILILFFGISFGLIYGLMNIPARKGKSASLSSLVSDRATEQEAAGKSRMELLKPLLNGVMAHPLIGSGFGATVTYHSKDPRILQNNPTGELTTFAFEWGYLDLWYKMGLLGLIAYIGLILTILISIFRQIKQKTDFNFLGVNINAINLGLIAALSALMAIHFFTPYLNHPLGIGFIILASLFLQFQYKKID